MLSQVESLLRALGELILILIRGILYVSGLVFIVLSISIICIAFYIQYIFQYLDLGSIQTGIYALIALGFYLCALSLYCVYALFSSNKSAIKGFTWLSIANVVFTVLALGLMWMRAEEFYMDLSKTLRQSMADYDWNHSDPQPDAHKELMTKAWDRVQVWRSCCGVKNYRDWDALRPMLDKGYPASCCNPRMVDHQRCDEQFVYKTNCVEAGARTVAIAGVALLSSIGFSVLIAILSVSKFLSCYPKTRTQSQNPNQCNDLESII